MGCLITNLLSPYGLLDLVVGTLATLLAAVWSGRCRSAWTAAVPPVVCNMVLVGAMLAWESTGFSAAFAGLFAYNALTVGIGEAAVCFLLGVPAAARSGKARHRVRIPQKTALFARSPRK